MSLAMFMYGVSKVEEKNVPTVVSEEWLTNNNYEFIDFDEDLFENNPQIKDLIPFGVMRESKDSPENCRFIYKAEELAYWENERRLHGFLRDNVDRVDNDTWIELDKDFVGDIVCFCRNHNIDPQSIEKPYDAIFYYEWW